MCQDMKFNSKADLLYQIYAVDKGSHNITNKDWCGPPQKSNNETKKQRHKETKKLKKPRNQETEET